MRILILSLLRIGDALMHIKIVRSLKCKYPNAQIEIAINDEFRQLEGLLASEVDRVHFFPRKKIQQLANSRDSHLLEPQWLLEEWTQSISDSKIDLLINMTHTKISGLVMHLIQANQKQGLVMNHLDHQLIGNEWLRYLNDQFPSGQKSEFHYIDVISRAFDISVEQDDFINNQSRRIFLQPLTSDSKKNWPLSSWKNLLELLRKNLIGYQISVLAAPSEISQLVPYFDENDLSILSFREAAEEFANCELLISGDTSLVHLATLTRTRSLVIALGSSDTIKTGPYLKGSVVISGRAACRPCHHTKDCHQESHLCAESISVGQISQLVFSLLQTSITIEIPNNLGMEGAHGQETRKLSRNSPRETRDCL